MQKFLCFEELGPYKGYKLVRWLPLWQIPTTWVILRSDAKWKKISIWFFITNQPEKGCHCLPPGSGVKSEPENRAWVTEGWMKTHLRGGNFHCAHLKYGYFYRKRESDSFIMKIIVLFKLKSMFYVHSYVIINGIRTHFNTYIFLVAHCHKWNKKSCSSWEKAMLWSRISSGWLASNDLLAMIIHIWKMHSDTD